MNTLPTDKSLYLAKHNTNNKHITNDFDYQINYYYERVIIVKPIQNKDK
jgi:hypothetical protein